MIDIIATFDRFLVCRSCKQEVDINKADYQFRKLRFTLYCKNCGYEGAADVKDVDKGS